ncbi:MAG: flotillin family protein, partial [Candidatus Dormibacteraeota bacterium]|nr:flotillin family protein [Candidatus Dormibacteraeota bacterium]
MLTGLLTGFALAVVVAAVLVLVVLLILFRATWRVAEPNEALVISGLRQRHEGIEQSLGFKIVTGKGTLVVPGVQVV